MLTLYQFPISHYCEKVLWALDHKGVPYQAVNLIPGPHVMTVRCLAATTSVPVIRDGERVVQDSTKILDYLDDRYPGRSLTPADPGLKKEALDWEEYGDGEIGPHLRRFFYYYILPDRRLASSLLLRQGPAYGPWLYSFAFPLVRRLMRKSMNIHPASAERSKQRLTAALGRLNDTLKSKNYLVGEAFTRADLTAASLLAPLFRPQGHHFQWPDDHQLPLALQQYQRDFQGSRVEQWVLGLYASHRLTHPHV